jgi:hypothetical protein
MARGCHELPTLSLGPAMPDPHMLCRLARAGVDHPQCGQPAAVFFPFGHPTPYAYVEK